MSNIGPFIYCYEKKIKDINLEKLMDALVLFRPAISFANVNTL